MFRSRKSSGKSRNRIDSLIAVGTRIEGNVIFSGGLRVDGEIVGNVGVEKDGVGVLVVSEKARIEGEVAVSHLVVNGAIVGPVRVSETLELQANARVTGDVQYVGLEMQQGAVVQGRLIHEADPKPVELKLANGT